MVCNLIFLSRLSFASASELGSFFSDYVFHIYIHLCFYVSESVGIESSDVTRVSHAAYEPVRSFTVRTVFFVFLAFLAIRYYSRSKCNACSMSM